MPEIPLATDDALELLSVDRRRRVLAELRDVDGAVSRRRLADRLAAASEESLRHVEIRLAHVDLPKLADAGLLEYDADAGTVVPTASAADVDPLLDLAARAEP